MDTGTYKPRTMGTSYLLSGPCPYLAGLEQGVSQPVSWSAIANQLTAGRDEKRSEDKREKEKKRLYSYLGKTQKPRLPEGREAEASTLERV